MCVCVCVCACARMCAWLLYIFAVDVFWLFSERRQSILFHNFPHTIDCTAGCRFPKLLQSENQTSQKSWNIWKGLSCTVLFFFFFVCVCVLFFSLFYFYYHFISLHGKKLVYKLEQFSDFIIYLFLIINTCTPWQNELNPHTNFYFFKQKTFT